jgi:hypothetical protein
VPPKATIKARVETTSAGLGWNLLMQVLLFFRIISHAAARSERDEFGAAIIKVSRIAAACRELDGRREGSSTGLAAGVQFGCSPAGAMGNGALRDPDNSVRTIAYILLLYYDPSSRPEGRIVSELGGGLSATTWFVQNRYPVRTIGSFG